MLTCILPFLHQSSTNVWNRYADRGIMKVQQVSTVSVTTCAAVHQAGLPSAINFLFRTWRRRHTELHTVLRRAYLRQTVERPAHNCEKSDLLYKYAKDTQRVNRKAGDRSPMGARVLPVSHNSWYFSTMPSRRPSARALFSYQQ